MDGSLYTRGEALFRFDPGWLYLIAGVAILGATVLIPASADLEGARLKRDWMLAIEGHRLERLERHAAYLDALDRGQESLVLSLAATQLNMIPTTRAAAVEWMGTVGGAGGVASASVFPGLEPPPLRPLRRIEQTSVLGRLATGERSRLWLLIVGGVCVLVGILPASRRMDRHVPARPG